MRCPSVKNESLVSSQLLPRGYADISYISCILRNTSMSLSGDHRCNADAMPTLPIAFLLSLDERNPAALLFLIDQGVGLQLGTTLTGTPAGTSILMHPFATAHSTA